MATLGGGYFSVRPFIRRRHELCSIAELRQTTEDPQHGRGTGGGKTLRTLGFSGWKSSEDMSARTHRPLGFYFIRDAEKTECRAKMKGQTQQCLVNVCQFFSHVICGYDPLANTSKRSALNIHSCLRHTFFPCGQVGEVRGAGSDRSLRSAPFRQEHGDGNRWTPN